MFWRLVFLCVCLSVLSVATLSEIAPEDRILIDTKIEAHFSNAVNKIEKNFNSSKTSKYFRESEKYENLEDFRIPWFTNVPLFSVEFARSKSLPDGPCKKQAQRYLRDLKNGTLWATQSEFKRLVFKSHSRTATIFCR